MRRMDCRIAGQPPAPRNDEKEETVIGKGGRNEPAYLCGRRETCPQGLLLRRLLYGLHRF